MPFFKKSIGLKTRIALAVALLVLLAVGLVTATSLMLAKREMRAVVGAQQFATLVAAGAYIDRDIDAKRTLLRATAEQMPAAIVNDDKQVAAYLASLTSLREEFFNVVAFDTHGTIIASLIARRPDEPVDVAQRDYFRDTVNYREGVVSAPFLSRLSGRPVVLITQPVTDPAGRLRFIIGGALDLTSPRIFGHLNAVKPGLSGYTTLMSGDGTLILHPDKQRLLERIADDRGADATPRAAAVGGFEGSMAGHTGTGVPAILTFRRLHTNDWIVGSVYPLHEAFAAFDRAAAQALATAVLVAALAGLAGWLGILKLLRPLAALQSHVQQAGAHGGDLEVFNVPRNDEFGRLSRAFYALSRQREAAEAALAAQALTDPLTGLANRRLFDSVIALAFARAARGKTMLAVAYLDIDRFKSINDAHGHSIGDRVLVEFAHRLRAAVRVTDTVVRLAGDEFTVVFETLADHADAHALGQKIIDAMLAPMRIDSHLLQVSSSVGICVGVTEGMLASDFITLADQALYAAKQNGRARYCLHLLPNHAAPA